MAGFAGRVEIADVGRGGRSLRARGHGRCKPPPAAPWAQTSACSSASPWRAVWVAGSSDAATCLVALNHLWNLHWSVDALAALGLKLGADVPVFVRGRAAWAEGIGERLNASLYPPQAPIRG